MSNKTIILFSSIISVVLIGCAVYCLAFDKEEEVIATAEQSFEQTEETFSETSKTSEFFSETSVFYETVESETELTSEIITVSETTVVTTTSPKITTTKVTTTAPKVTSTKVTTTTTPKVATTRVTTTAPKVTTTKVTTTAPKVTTTRVTTTVPEVTTTRITTTIPEVTTTRATTTAPKVTTTKATTTTPKVTTTTPRVTTTTTKATTLSEEQIEQQYIAEVISLVNQIRVQNGLSELKTDVNLQKAADIRADEVAVLFSHTRPDGTRCFTVFDETGVVNRGGAENIAQGYKTPDAVMVGWIMSEGHRANILNESMTRIAVGYDAETKTWVQLFAV